MGRLDKEGFYDGDRTPQDRNGCPFPDGRYGKFVVEPLERGSAQRLGNSLRRVLCPACPVWLSTSVKIDGVVHEFSTIEGVHEDVTEIVLNLKGIAAKIYGEAQDRPR